MSQLRNLLFQHGGSPTPPYTVLDHCYVNNSPVNLGFKLKDTFTFLTISFTIKNSQWVFGSRDYQTSPERFTYQAGGSSSNVIACNVISNTITVPVTDKSTRIDFTFTNEGFTCINEGITNTVATTRGFPNSERNVVLGSIYNGATLVSSNRMTGYFWKLQAKDNDVLVHDIVPVLDTDNVCCLYDKVTGELLYPIVGTLTPEEPVGLMMVNPGSLQMNLDNGDELDVEPTDDEEEER